MQNLSSKSITSFCCSFYFVLFLLGLLIGSPVSSVWATHNLAGQITYTKEAPNTYRIVLTTYTDPSKNVDRCFADIEVWNLRGFGTQKVEKELITTLQAIPRSNGSPGGCESPALMGIVIRSPIKKNYYETIFRFNGPGIFELRYRDLARVEYVKNMSNSGATSFYVETILNNTPFWGDNSSPHLLNDPLDDACTNKLWTHNPGGYDPDGDSLAYELINCQQYDPPNIPSPTSTNGFASPGVGNGPFTINPITGIITWNTAKSAGWYNAAILIKEYRNGKLIGWVIRDMAINVKLCTNNPPKISSIVDTCVRAGTLLRIPVRAWETDRLDDIYFSLNNNENKTFNGPFSVASNPAQILQYGKPLDLNQFPIKTRNPLEFNLELVWQTDCSHIRQSVYQIDYYAQDNVEYHPNTPRLAANWATTIRVVPAPVQNVRAEPDSRKIKVSWDPHECSSVMGYEVYRSTNIDAQPIDTICCKDRRGLPAELGYVRVGYFASKDILSMVDDNFGKGLDYKAQYCYRVLALFPGGMKSCASKDTCIRVFRDMPIITHNTVEKTDRSAGEIHIVWSKPDTTKIKSEFFPKPYSYEIHRSDGIVNGNFTKLNIPNKDFLDTVFTDTNLPTENTPFQYVIKLVDATMKPFAQSDSASSIFLTAIPGNKYLRLVWREYVPWINKEYKIFRKAPGETDFTQIALIKGDQSVIGNKNGIISQHTYVDRNLELGKEYCYYIDGWGTYLEPPFEELYNKSNIRCAVPMDTTPPCLPGPDSILVKEDCENFRIDFSWIAPDSLCAEDLAFYSIYYKPTPNAPYIFLTKTTDPKQLQLLVDNSAMQNIAGCYAFTATDNVGNESGKSKDFCLDNCPVWELPNIFSPNNDGINDILTPVVVRSIRSITFKVYDRWGMELHISNDPKNLWNGLTKSGVSASEGYYFYTADIVLDNMNAKVIKRAGGFSLVR